MTRYIEEVTLGRLEKGLDGVSGRMVLKAFFGISCFFAFFSVVLFITYNLSGSGTTFFSCLERVLKHVPKQFINNDGIKNVTMTVGLTGVIFTWLLQIISEHECGLPISKLLKKVFPEYTIQLGLFIGAVLLCIYCSSMEICDSIDKLALALMFLSTLSGIWVMWIMCGMFLFSRDRRRHAAFACLVNEMDGSEEVEVAKWNWCRELPNCLSGGENENVYVKYFLGRIKKAETALDREERDAHTRKCYEFVWELTSKTEPNARQKIPALIREAHKNRNDRIFLLSLYILSLSDLYSEQGTERMSGEGWSKDKYTYIWHYLIEKDLLEHAHCADSLYVYMAFVSVYGHMKEEENPERAEKLIESQGNKIPDLYKRRHTIGTAFILFLRSENAVSMREISLFDGGQDMYDYYNTLCDLVQVSDSHGPSVESETDVKSGDNDKMYTDLRVINLDRLRNLAEPQIGENEWIALGHFDKLEVVHLGKSGKENLSRKVDLQLILENNQSISQLDGEVLSYRQPLYILHEFNKQEFEQVENFWSLDSPFMLIARVHSKLNDQEDFELFVNECIGENDNGRMPKSYKAIEKDTLVGKDVYYILYRTLELSDVILVAKSKSIEKLLRTVGRLYYLPCVGDTYSYFGIAENEIYGSSGSASDKDKIPVMLTRFAVKDARACHEFLKKFMNKSIKPRFKRPVLVTGNEDIMAVLPNLSSKKLCAALRRFLSQPELFSEAFSDMTTRLSVDEKSLGNRSQVPKDSEGKNDEYNLYAGYEELYYRFQSLCEKCTDSHGIPDWVRPIGELLRSMLTISRDYVLRQICYTVFDGISSIVRLSENIVRLDAGSDEALSKTAMLRRAYSGTIMLIEHMIRMEGELVHHPETRPLLYDIPANLLELYLGFSYRCLKYFQQREPDAPKKTYKLLTIPCMCHKISIWNTSYGRDTKEELLYVEIPLERLYYPKYAICSLVHEVAHFGGEETRCRKKRSDSLVFCVAYYIASFQGVQDDDGKVTEIKDYLLANIPETKRKYMAELIPAVKAAVNKLQEESDLQIPSDVLRKKREEGYDFFEDITNEIEEIKDLFEEPYADMEMFHLLNLDIECYLGMLRRGLEFNLESVTTICTVERAALVLYTIYGDKFDELRYALSNLKGEFSKEVRKYLEWFHEKHVEMDSWSERYHSFKITGSVCLYLRDCLNEIIRCDNLEQNRSKMEAVRKSFEAFADRELFASDEFYKELQKNRLDLIGGG